ncbi:hypothetical protein P691DRAFT_711070 [Macrolepiota fuliginosa MF-IS2]|uniref:Uncharacterized protein n=1 Tax=Macrolepiota fuliginosa MF-IS2 TaxID=1400762 RepID=A0A9P5X7U4_9AGAR|nr:hypothetical protein P691DRAFT_711070 [Macrolepiota fuliginosa MF-IS2]
MPGPTNNKKKQKRKAQLKNKKKKTNPKPPTPPPSNPPSSPSSVVEFWTPPQSDAYQASVSQYSPCRDYEYDSNPLIPEKPFIYDPGNGPRVRDTRAFLSSKFFSQPPAWDVPLCAEFAQDEVLEMIRTVLPEELALILWYNKSRATSRICPACQRLFRLGDNLPEHMTLSDTEYFQQNTPSHLPNPRMLREQEVSGLCSPVCFILAAFNYPGAIQSAWGRMGDEMDEESWTLLNGPGDGTTHSDLSQGLGMLVKMTRLYDLGLAQLCFDDDDWATTEASESELM